MSQPTKYERSHDFTHDERGEIDTQALNDELDGASLSINEIRANLALIQRDDGKLVNKSVGLDQLTDDAAEELSKYVENKIEPLVRQSTAAAEASEQSRVGAANAAQNASSSAAAALRNKNASDTNVQLSKIWAEGTDAQVHAIGGEKSSKGYTEAFGVHVEEKTEEFDSHVTEKTEESKEEITDHTEEKKEELYDIAELIKSGWGYQSQEVVFTLQSAVSAGTTIQIPDEFSYAVGHKHLRVSVNNVPWDRGLQFAEVGTKDTLSSAFKTLIPMRRGTVINCYACALGSGGASTKAEAQDIIDACNDVIDNQLES